MSISEKIQMIFRKEQVERIKVLETDPDAIYVVVDVHGMKCCQAKQFINNLINLARCKCVLTVIHGYKHGDAILNMVRNDLENKHITKKYLNNYNMGVTYLAIA